MRGVRTEAAQLVLMAFGAAALAGYMPSRAARQEHAEQTTEAARKLVRDRIEAIAGTGSCKQGFAKENIDLDRLRRTANQTRFYGVVGLEGEFRFSEAVGKAAAPDETLRALALQVPADAFVLGYLDGRRYVRTKHVVLNRGYFEQGDTSDGTLRPTTREEKQSLLLHELLHIALDKDDDDLNQRELCPLRLLTFCPRPPGSSTGIKYRPGHIFGLTDTQ